MQVYDKQMCALLCFLSFFLKSSRFPGLQIKQVDEHIS